MTAFFQNLMSMLRAAPRGDFGVPKALMGSAQASAGHNPRYARELRSAAVAALRVVR